jgi:hypothetical protein
MKRFLTLAVAGVLALGLASTAYANLCAYDVVPAATLLFPFVSYDYPAGEAGDAGATTLFAITNVSSAAQIVHITVWTDYSIAILDFNLTLTGYDVQTINIRDILRDGILPYEGVGANIWEVNNWDGDPAPVPQDLGPFSSNNQLFGSALDGWFGAVGLPAPAATGGLRCDPAVYDASPNNYGASLPIDGTTLANFRSFLEASMTATKWYADCTIAAGPPIDPTVTVGGDGSVVIPAADFDPNLPTPWWIVEDFVHPAWMYVTADVVGACNKDLPDGSPATYFSTAVDTAGVITDNVLMGDMMWLDPADEAGGVNFSEADVAVHLEASPGFFFGFPADDGDMTSFYHRYHAGNSALQDYREPLGTAWGVRYLHAPNAADAANTYIRAWKGSTNQALVQDLDDGSYTVDPATLYANSCTPYTYYAWDEDENVISVTGGFIPPWSGEDPQPLPQPNLFPLETQEVPARQFYLVGDPDVAFGWLLFIWPRSNTTNAFLGTGAVSDQYQTWMGVKYQAFGNSSVAFSGNQIANYNCQGEFRGSLPFPGLGRYSE